MIDLDTIPHHSVIDELVGVICNKTQNVDRGFYPVMVAYFLGKVASSMRVNVVTRDRGEIPVNIYTLALAGSGSGKGFSVNILEEQILGGFKKRFLSETFPTMADQNLWKLATDRSLMSGLEEKEEYEKLEKEFRKAGALAFTFDSGTSPAVKQLRHKLLLANAGSINLQIDEIGSNLINSTEILNTFLELYDKGLIKQKLTKNTAENERSEEMDGMTPTNMLLFGVPAKLLDGGATEEAFYSFLETGYARRCIFGSGQRIRTDTTLTPAELYSRMLEPSNDSMVTKWHTHFTLLADPQRFGWKVNMPDNVAIELLGYKIECEALADTLPEHEDILKSEISHRYYKTLKLAGAFAYIDECADMDMSHLHQAMKLVEESGNSFKSILKREKTYVRLARYLADVGSDQTHADLTEQLPFYKSGTGARNEIMGLAMAWGYKNHVMIKKSFSDGIEFYRGEALKMTSLERVRISYSDHFATGFRPEEVPFRELGNLFGLAGYNWSNHFFNGFHRADEFIIPEFNLFVMDLDGAISLSLVHDLLKDYQFITYTTKRHTETENRFRVVMPMNYHLKLDNAEYKKFYENVMTWMPFKEVDMTANQRSKKWSTCHNTQFFLNEGMLLDVLPFVPKTSKNEQYNAGFQAVSSLDNLERWFAERLVTGDRNNTMIKYALALVDGGLPYHEVEARVLSLNARVANPMTEDRIRNSILITVAKKTQGAAP